MRHLLPFIGLCLAGCVSAPWPDASENVDRISYELTHPAFCGGCDGVTIIVDAAGRVWIERRSWQEQGRSRRQSMEVPRDRFEAFRTALMPYRPDRNRSIESVRCDSYVLHSSEVRVTWSDVHGEVSRVFLLGCSNEEAINASVVAAPGLLGLGAQAGLW